jgi:hypothetical protein
MKAVRSPVRKRNAFWVALTAVVLLQASLLSYAVFRQSAVSDEYGHFYAGLAYWRQGDVRLFNVNPPLVRCLGTMLASRYEWSTPNSDWTAPQRPEFSEGRHLAETHRSKFVHGLQLGRMVVAGFAILGTVVCSVWGRMLAGDLAGVVAGGFWAFQPQVIAHGALITNDIPVAASMLLATWCFSRWSQQAAYRWALAVGASLAVAVLCKFTALLLWPIFAGFTVATLYRTCVRTVVLHATTAILIMLILIAAAYRFKGIGKPLTELKFVSHMFSGVTEATSHPNQLTGGLLGILRSPFPEQFVLGLDRQQLDFETGMSSYARGQRSSHGWWWFYLYSMLVKLPVGTLLAIGVTIICSLRGDVSFTRHHLLPAVIALALIEVTALKSGFAQQHRYIFPLYPFMCILIATPVAKSGHRRVAGRMVLAGLLLTIVGAGWAAPNWLGAFNLISGGTNRSHYHLFNDATDWGQDTDRVIKWLRDNPQCRPFRLYSTNSFLGLSSLADVAQDVGVTGPLQSTWYIVSKTDLAMNPDLERRFLERVPDFRIGATHLVYWVDEVAGDQLGNGTVPTAKLRLLGD